MEIKQKRGSSQTRYVFHEDRVEYAWKDSSGSRSFSVPYTGISRDRESLTERNVWARNAGVLWIIIGAFLLAVSIGSGEEARGGFWLILGLACVATWWLRVARYTILPSEKGNLLVIEGKDGDMIVGEIESRRAEQFRSEYDFVPDGASPEQLHNRFKWLHREGALSDDELQSRLDAIEGSPQDAANAPDAEPDGEPDHIPAGPRSLH